MHREPLDSNRIARLTGIALLLVIAIGIAASVLISGGININVQPDAAAILENISGAVPRVYGKAYVSAGLALVDVAIAAGLYLLLRDRGAMLALWSLVVAILGAALVVEGALDTLKIATLLDSERLAAVPPDQLRTLLVGALAGDYSSFHLGLVVNACAKAGFFALFVRTRRIAAPIAWLGLIASLYVVVAIVGRTFVAALGHDAVTMTFIIGNLVANLALGLYLAIRGVRTASELDG